MDKFLTSLKDIKENKQGLSREALIEKLKTLLIEIKIHHDKINIKTPTILLIISIILVIISPISMILTIFVAFPVLWTGIIMFIVSLILVIVRNSERKKVMEIYTDVQDYLKMLQPDYDNKDDNMTVIGGVVIGGVAIAFVVILLIAGGIGFYMYKRKKSQKTVELVPESE